MKLNYKNMKTKLTIGCILLLSAMNAQISGNHVTGNEVYNSYNKNSSLKKMYHLAEYTPFCLSVFCL